MKLYDLANSSAYFASNCRKSIYENKKGILKAAACIGTGIAIGAYIRNSQIFSTEMNNCFKKTINYILDRKNKIAEHSNNADCPNLEHSFNVMGSDECYPGFTPFKRSFSFSQGTTPSKEAMLKEVSELSDEATSNGWDMFSTFGYSASFNATYLPSIDENQATFLICKKSKPW